MHDSQMLVGTINAQQDELKVFELERVGGFSLARRVPNVTITCYFKDCKSKEALS